MLGSFFLKRAVGSQGDTVSSEKSPGRLESHTLSPGSGGCSLTALFSVINIAMKAGFKARNSYLGTTFGGIVFKLFPVFFCFSWVLLPLYCIPGIIFSTRYNAVCFLFIPG